MKAGSLFSGLGGLDLGLEWAGFEIAWQCEIDDYRTAWLEINWPNVRRYGDIKTTDWSKAERVDLICGGPPCQPFSTAGKRLGSKDERNLWPQMLEVVGTLRPMWVVGENVPNLGNYLDWVLSDLEAKGYECLPLEIPAAAFGAWHLRYRIFVIAHLNGEGQQNDPGIGEHEARGDAGIITNSNRGRQQSPEHALRSRGTGASSDATRHGARYLSERPRATGPGEIDLDRQIEEARAIPYWQTEPDVGRLVYGLSPGMGRLARRRVAGLGNAVVPQVAEWIFRRIMEVENA